MANRIKKFFSEQFGELRTIKSGGQTWFFAADVCRVLEHSNPRKAVASLDKDERMTVTIGYGQKTRGGAQIANVVNEFGLWQLVIKSRLPKAKAFKRWLTHDVIPSIRRNGGYIAGQEKLSDNDKKELFAKIKQLEKEVARLSAKNGELTEELAAKEEEYEDTLKLMRDNNSVTRIRTNDGGYVTEEAFNRFYA